MTVGDARRRWSPFGSSAGAVAAEFDAIQDRLLALASLQKTGAAGNLFSVMSRIDGEGATTVAIGFARAVGRTRSARVLLIDFDAGVGGAADVLGLTPRAFPGFGAAHDAPRLADFVMSVEPDRLDLITIDPSVPADALGDPLWDDAFRTLVADYTAVVVDTGSLLGSMPLRWASISRANILVTDTTRTTEEELVRLKAELKTIELHIHGVVLNKRQYHVPALLYRHLR